MFEGTATFGPLSEKRVIEQSLVLTNPEAFAMDWDGVISDHKNPLQAQRLRPLLLEKSLGNGRPLAVITGKEEVDAYREIVTPCREDLQRLGIQITPGDFSVYANNGSNLIDVAEAVTLERREFTNDKVIKILRTATIQAVMEVYAALDGLYPGIAPEQRESHFRKKDNSTICFRIHENDLDDSRLPSELTSKLFHLKKGNHLTRFDLAEQIQEELTTLGFGEVVVSPTDRSVDLTPAGTGKRQALVRFSDKHQIPIDKIFRVDDSPAGMGFGLTAPYANLGERQPGYTNVVLDRELIHRVQESAKWSGFGSPREIPAPVGMDQFEKVEWLLQQVTPRVSQVFSTLAA